MEPLEKFLSTYNQLGSHNLDLLAEIYSEDVRFVDPVHEITGLVALRDYFAGLYESITAVSFDFTERISSPGKSFVEWKMQFSHPKLARGATITLSGVSHLQFNEDGRVCYHRDYFDLGEMLYEHIPLLGKMVLYCKRRLGQ
jgi:limonene-1,2-epoxide hydrolase